jgi:hypothetical protein
MPIAWVELTFNGKDIKKHPLNWDETNNVFAGYNEETGEIDYNKIKGDICFSEENQYFRFLRTEARNAFIRAGGVVFRSHFDTCPEADKYRKPKAAKGKENSLF